MTSVVVALNSTVRADYSSHRDIMMKVTTTDNNDEHDFSSLFLKYIRLFVFDLCSLLGLRYIFDYFPLVHDNHDIILLKQSV